MKKHQTPKRVNLTDDRTFLEPNQRSLSTECENETTLLRAAPKEVKEIKE